jgi:hypothetical protein
VGGFEWFISDQEQDSQNGVEREAQRHQDDKIRHGDKLYQPYLIGLR